MENALYHSWVVHSCAVQVASLVWMIQKGEMKSI